MHWHEQPFFLWISHVLFCLVTSMLLTQMELNQVQYQRIEPLLPR